MKENCIKAYLVLMLLIISGNHCYAINTASLDTIRQQEPPSGLYASNVVIYISDKTTITLEKDLVLDHSTITGEGDLVMKSNKRQVIKSKNGIIHRLILDNPTETLLVGDLEITKSLTVKTGKFNISKGKLIINPDNIKLLNGASIFNGPKAELTKADGTESLSSQYTFTGGSLIASDWETPFFSNNYNQRIGFITSFYVPIIQKIDSIPPEFI